MTPGGGQGPKPPSPLISSQAYITDVARVAEIAGALGYAADAAAFSALHARLLAEYNTAFLNANGVYGHANGDGLQSAHAASLAIGAAGSSGPAYQSAVDLFARDISITHAGAWMVGISGNKFFHSTLTAGGYGDLAVDTILRQAYPGFWYMFNNENEPATTLWELPDGDAEGPGMNSRNHHMFSSVGAWLYQVRLPGGRGGGRWWMVVMWGVDGCRGGPPPHRLHPLLISLHGWLKVWWSPILHQPHIPNRTRPPRTSLASAPALLLPPPWLASPTRSSTHA